MEEKKLTFDDLVETLRKRKEELERQKAEQKIAEDADDER